MTTLNNFITRQYDDIMLMSKKITKSHSEWEELGHYCIVKFMEHERAEELIDANRAMNFISGIMHRSFHSSTSQYHSDIRQKGRVHGITPNTPLKETGIEYSHDKDILVDTIEVILEEMIAESKEQWFRSVLFQMWSKNPNYSSISRDVGVPRTTISRAVEEAREYIKEELKNRGLDGL